MPVCSCTEEEQKSVRVWQYGKCENAIQRKPLKLISALLTKYVYKKEDKNCRGFIKLSVKILSEDESKNLRKKEKAKGLKIKEEDEEKVICSSRQVSWVSFCP